MFYFAHLSVCLQVFPDEVFSVLSSVNEELIKRCQYLEVSLVSYLLYT